MASERNIQSVRKSIENNPTVLSLVSAATGILRQLAIKPHTQRVKHRQLALRGRWDSLHTVHNRIFHEKGAGDMPTIVIGGFVPDATEAVEFQRPLFRGYGSVYYINYARRGFSLELFQAQLADLVEELNRQGERPVLFAISFGCGLLASFLERNPDARIRGAVLVSPVLCTDDLVRPERAKGDGVRILESNLRRILRADVTGGDELDRQIQRARRCFQSLFAAGAENRVLSSRHLSIRKKIMEVLEKTSSAGGHQRVLALSRFTRPEANRPLYDGPTLVLSAQSEGDLLVPGSPTMGILADPGRRTVLFPRGCFRQVRSHQDSDPVPHASLIFHQHCYNPLISAWYDKLQAPRLFSVV